MKKKYFMLSEGLEASKKAKQAEEAKNIVDYLKSIGDYKQAERISTGSPNLTLTSNHLFQLNTDKLSKLLKEYPSVKILKFEQNMNGYGQCFPDEEKGLTEILKNNKTISELIINTNDTQDAGLIKIAELIKGYRNITSLEYNRGKISCLGAKAIAEAILENQSMIKIKLGKVEDFETYELILNSLKQNNYITHVSICFTTGTELGFNNRNNEYSNQSLYYSFNKAVYGFATNHHSFTKRELIELLEKDKIFIKSQLILQPALLHYEDINGDRFWFEPKQIFSLLKKYKNENFLKLAHVVKEKVIADKDYTTEDVQFIELMNNYLNLEKIDLGKFVLFSKLPKEIQTYIFSFCKLSDIKEIGLLGSLQSEKE